MVKINFGKKIVATVTFIVISLAIVLDGYNAQNASAIGGTEYIKYDYKTNKSSSYTLSEINTANFANNNLSKLGYSDDPRVDASTDQTVINIGFNGTGFIIGDHEIMTAAHALYDIGGKKFCTENYEFMINSTNPSNSNKNTVTYLTPVSAHIPKQFKTNVDKYGYSSSRDAQYDYAILTVSEDLSKYGKFYLGAATNKVLNNSNIPIHILGFYYYLEDVSYDSDLKKSDGYVTSLSSNALRTNAYVTDGTSGAPIYVESYFGVPGSSNDTYSMKRYRTVIGVVSSAACDGPRVGSKILQFAYNNKNL